ncbi:hypothetical protein GDO81_022934 [Engystomops pustulosus]|uniref:Uncharacterized protein n=1 Tax=Engystomops pustulosus TaxID=76066 RepID=A0AAV6Z5G7_ENGPU|nr:hypothetical protein GDO81_022934 [Engystomops pustulosus]
MKIICPGQIQSKTLLIEDEEEHVAAMPIISTETCHERGLSPRNRVVVVMVAAMLIVIFMVMLLLWNYKCIVIDRLCQGIDEVKTPIFTND